MTPVEGTFVLLLTVCSVVVALGGYFHIRLHIKRLRSTREWQTIHEAQTALTWAKGELDVERDDYKRKVRVEVKTEMAAAREKFKQDVAYIRDKMREEGERNRAQLKQAEEELAKERQDVRRTLEQERAEILQTANEKSKGFPWLAEAYADLAFLKSQEIANHLRSKKHPAVTAARRVQEIGRVRRTVEKKLRIAQGIIKYWESLFPFLEDLVGTTDDEMLRSILSRNVDEPIREITESGVDPVRFYTRLSEEEYEKLSTRERNQLALDRWQKRGKTKWEIGRDYERFVGYKYESEGYGVYYQGILEGYEDLGRDLIAKRDGETLVIQCKKWSRHKNIHECHVNQLFGTKTKYGLDHADETVIPVLFTSTTLSSMAKRFAEALGVVVKEEVPLGDYPMIKCNISRRDNERIYHLPFDQQYDTTIIEPEKGERYCWTVAEAEELGFRRAWRWHGDNE